MKIVRNNCLERVKVTCVWGAKWGSASGANHELDRPLRPPRRPTASSNTTSPLPSQLNINKHPRHQLLINNRDSFEAEFDTDLLTLLLHTSSSGVLYSPHIRPARASASSAQSSKPTPPRFSIAIRYINIHRRSTERQPLQLYFPTPIYHFLYESLLQPRYRRRDDGTMLKRFLTTDCVRLLLRSILQFFHPLLSYKSHWSFISRSSVYSEVVCHPNLPFLGPGFQLFADCSHCYSQFSISCWNWILYHTEAAVPVGAYTHAVLGSINGGNQPVWKLPCHLKMHSPVIQRLSHLTLAITITGMNTCLVIFWTRCRFSASPRYRCFKDSGFIVVPLSTLVLIHPLSSPCQDFRILSLTWLLSGFGYSTWPMT